MGRLLYTGLAQLVEHWSPKPGVGSSSLSTRAKFFRIMKKIGEYLKNSYNELVYKVTWPTRSELTNSAVVVMIASVIMALAVFGVDTFFEWIIGLVYSIGKIASN